jgi:hypothetical protein
MNDDTADIKYDRQWRRRCDKRLKQVMHKILKIDFDLLRHREVVEILAQQAGLVRDHDGVYGDDEIFANPITRGIWQIPGQLADFAIFLSGHKINSFIEIGAFTGGTFTFLMAYLTRFNDRLVGIAMDSADHFKIPQHLWARNFNAQFIIGTSTDFAGQSFDLCLIDANHSFNAVTADYANVGRHSRICAFHDINDASVEALPEHDGGVPRFWRQFKKTHPHLEFHEFLSHTKGSPVMGIGAVIHKPGKLADLMRARALTLPAGDKNAEAVPELHFP